MSRARPFEALTPGGQLRRLGRLAERATRRLGLGDATIESLVHWENATFRVSAASGSYLLRVHSPDYNRPSEIRSELTWLRALRADTDVRVPEPAAEAIEVSERLVPSPRTVTLLRWMEGRKMGAGLGAARYRALGAVMARLHEHGTRWRPPRGFTRRRWDPMGLFRWWPDAIHDEVVGELSARQRRLFGRAQRRLSEVTEALGEGPDVFGLIHADLHPHNVLVHRGELRPIDFDDCRFGWLLYDLAVPLRSARRSDAPDALRAALLEGYREVRPLPAEHEALLPLFEQARALTIAYFCLWRGRTHDGLRRAARRVVPEVERLLAEPGLP